MDIQKAKSLEVIFLWHPADRETVAALVEYVFKKLSSDTAKPFSRSMNLPVFFWTSIMEP